jgi:hypothetical protein
MMLLVLITPEPTNNPAGHGSPVINHPPPSKQPRSTLIAHPWAPYPLLPTGVVVKVMVIDDDFEVKCCH